MIVSPSNPQLGLGGKEDLQSFHSTLLALFTY